MSNLRSVAFSIVCSASVLSTAHASLTFLGAAPPLNRPANLVVNGSFEAGAPPFGVQVPWASPSTPGYAVPPGWSSSGVDGSTYATWGSDGVPGQGIRSSAPFPHGRSGLYFGNLFTDVNIPPTFQPDGRVTFGSTPVFTPTFGGTCELFQTVNTQLTPAPSYRLSFWVSGEDASIPNNNWTPGIMGFRMTNVLAGDPIQFLSIPGATGGPNNRLYNYSFTPLNPLLPVTLNFINWGHVTTIGGISSGFTTELVLDDVIINPVPEPASLALLALGGLGLARRRMT